MRLVHYGREAFYRVKDSQMGGLDLSRTHVTLCCQSGMHGTPNKHARLLDPLYLPPTPSKECLIKHARMCAWSLKGSTIAYEPYKIAQSCA